MDDLINRQAVIEHLQRIIDSTNTDGRYNLGFIDGLEFCIDDLSTMPSAQSEQKKGKWIDLGGDAFECSVCHEISCCAGNYCPDCGIKMEGIRRWTF